MGKKLAGSVKEEGVVGSVGKQKKKGEREKHGGSTTNWKSSRPQVLGELVGRRMGGSY